MAIVLSSPENINFLFFLVKLAIAIGTITILLLLVFLLRLKNIEKRMYLIKNPLKKRLNHPKPKKQSLVTTKIGLPRQTSNLVNNYDRSPMTQVFYESPKTSAKTTKILAKTLTKTLVKPSKRNGHGRLSWFLAIAIASITGIAIALIQLGNAWISPEISTFIWFFIGVMLIVSASLIKVA